MADLILTNRKAIKLITERKKELEDRLGVTISLTGKKITFDGPALHEYEAEIVFGAINFGFPIKIALDLKNPEIAFQKLNIKDFTRRKNLRDVKARVIGKEGKTKRTLADLGDCDIVVNNNDIGIICPTENMQEEITAITNLIRGSKEANVYKYLERMNRERKKHKFK